MKAASVWAVLLFAVAPALAVSGTQSVSFIQVKFRNAPAPALTREAVTAQFETLNAFYKAASFGALQFALGDITLQYPVDLDRPAACDAQSFSWPPPDLAVADLIPQALRGSDHVVLITDCGTFSASNNASGANLGVAWTAPNLILGGQNIFQGGTLIHEIGHNLGLGHAHALRCKDAQAQPIPMRDGPASSCLSPFDFASGASYGDFFDVMGGGQGFGRYFAGMGDLSAPHKAQLGWLSGRDASTDGDYALAPLELASSQPQALRIPAFDGHAYFVEYRRRIGNDAAAGAPGVEGVQVRVDGGAGDPGGTSLLLAHGTPDDATLSAGQALTLVSGGTETDPHNLTLTVVSLAPDQAVVRLRFGPVATTPPPPAPPPAGYWPLPPRSGYSSPLKGFVGRYLDSQMQGEIQFPFRTARAYETAVAPERNRVYMIVGSALAAFDLDTFFSRLGAGEPLMPVTSIPIYNIQRQGVPEAFLKWDRWFYAESGGGWRIPLMDGQDFLWDFDWDDRGYVYLAYSAFGWGIALDQGSGGHGARMPSIFQSSEGTLSPTSILAFKTGAGRRYVLVSNSRDASTSELWSVDDAAQPQAQGTIPVGIASRAKSADGTRIAVVDPQGRLRIFSNDSLVTGTPLAAFPGFWAAVDTDGVNFYASTWEITPQGQRLNAQIVILSPSGSGYALKRVPLDAPYWGLRYGAGRVTLWRNATPGAGASLRLFQVSGDGLRELALGSVLDDYYRKPLRCGRLDRGPALPARYGGRDYLIYADTGLGDVYELDGGTPGLTAAVVSPGEGASLAGAASVEAQTCGEEAASKAELYDGATLLGVMTPGTPMAPAAR